MNIFAQVNLNGSFEAPADNGRLTRWFFPQGTTASFDGRQRMRIQSTSDCKVINFIAFYQTLDYLLFKELDDITLGTPANCAPEFERSGQPSMDIQTGKWRGNWTMEHRRHQLIR